jgi:hypothetical protein
MDDWEAYNGDGAYAWSMAVSGFDNSNTKISTDDQHVEVSSKSSYRLAVFYDILVITPESHGGQGNSEYMQFTIGSDSWTESTPQRCTVAKGSTKDHPGKYGTVSKTSLGSIV